jgi:D-alanyl-D-alanine dipeptidase
VRWAEDLADTRTKTRYYPQVAKDRLFREGYIAERSGHSRGSTVDLTIVSVAGDDRVELDMGTPFDFFDPRSHGESTVVTAAQRAHRLLLRSVMEKHGFRPLAEEWWHFTLVDEPFPERYFDFPVR